MVEAHRRSVPPTAAEADASLDDDSPTAWERLMDDLLERGKTEDVYLLTLGGPPNELIVALEAMPSVVSAELPEFEVCMCVSRLHSVSLDPRRHRASS